MKKQKTIFELESIKSSRAEKPKYPQFDVYKMPIGVFSSLEKAEQAMAKYVKTFRDSSSFGFMVNELALDKTTYYEAKKRRSYLADGSFLDETLVSEISDDGKNGSLEEFLGRPADKIRFNPGDLVEVLFGDKVTLEIIGQPSAMTTEELRELHRLNDKYGTGRARLDYTDDTYYTLNLNSMRGHSQAVSTFPVRLKVSKKLKEKFDAIYANPESWD